MDFRRLNPNMRQGGWPRRASDERRRYGDMALEHGDRVGRASGAASDVKRQQHEHELVSSFLCAGVGDGFQAGVVKQCNTEVE